MSRILFLVVLFIIACGSPQKNNSVGSSSLPYPDTTYCASIDYLNPNTDTRSNYTLLVQVSANQVSAIDWPNGGVLDQHHFASAVLDEEGHTTFTTDRGYEMEVTIKGMSDHCFDSVPGIKQCAGKTRTGAQCKHLTDNASGYCWQHEKS